MLLALNPENKHLSADCPTVCNQGQLLVYLTQNPFEEVLIDPELPGHLKIEDFFSILKKRFPNAGLSLISTEEKKSQINDKSLVIYFLLNYLVSGTCITVFTVGTPFQKQTIFISLCALLTGGVFAYVTKCFLERR